MGIFKKKNDFIEKLRENAIEYAIELKDIIMQANWEGKENIDVGGLEYATVYYDLEFFRQVMSIKYSRFQMELAIRTIFNTIESNLREAGNNIKDGYMFDKFVKLSNSIHQIYNISKENGEDEFCGVAMYMLSDECLMSEKEIMDNYEIVQNIARHFRKIINIDINKI